MKYLIIGTAGHVDHGKSAIIKALTGTNTDRLKEEKLRGISIDLGFASLNLGEEVVAGIVDVPGHERFLKNMLAGTGGIDMVMLVIAADEGVMPQTREHLAMLNLYGVRHGLVVMNKIDKVDAEWLELVEEEVAALLQKTFLAQAPVCRVSAVTGEGIEQLHQTLQMLGRRVPSRDSMAPFRLWVDRVFTIKGHGAVVTGSVLSGSAKIGDTLELYPEQKTVRVRGLESHGNKLEKIRAGQRAAINVAGVEMSEVARGMALSVPERSQMSAEWDVMVDWYQEEVGSGTRIRLHLGTGETIGRIYHFKDASATFQRLILESPLAASGSDRGILRLYSPQHLLGGVMLIAPSKRSRRLSAHRSELAKALATADHSKVIYYILAEAGKPLTASEIKALAGYVRESVIDEILAKIVLDKRVVLLDQYYIDTVSLAELTKKIVALLKKYHQEEPERAGLSQEISKQKLKLEDKVFDTLLLYWKQQKLLVLHGGDIALTTHAATHSDWRQDLVMKAENVFDGSGLVNIDISLVIEKLLLPADKGKAAFDNLVRQGVLVRVGDMHVYRKTIQYILEILVKHFAEHPTLTVAELRDLLSTSRKVALPLVEYFDMHKYTVREGDMRRPGLKIKELSEKTLF